MTRPCVIDRPARRRRRQREESQQPRLELPLHAPPQHEQARPQQSDEPPERGTVIVDFYI